MRSSVALLQRRVWTLLAVGFAFITHATELPSTVRLYVFDCGSYGITNLARFSLTREEVETTDLSIACFLVAHPKGTLIWDTGCVPDKAWQPTGSLVIHHLVLPDGQERDVRLTKPLLTQLSDVGYAPADITYLALSHYHFDHTANANEFADATWLVRPVEREAMFAEQKPPVTQPSTYAALRNSKTRLLEEPDFDVFGDRTVIIKLAAGHTPGHQVLYVKLTHTGGVLLSGDLYHYPASRKLKRVPIFDFDPEQSRKSREEIESFLAKTGAQLWIQHDYIANSKLRKASEFYD